MTIKTATDATPTSALDAEYRALALAAAQGDASASKKLMQVEDKIDAMARSERRKVAAEAEGQRVAVLAQEEASHAERQAKEQLHADLLERREAAFVEIEAKTRSLAEVVAYALICDSDVWAAAMQLGYHAETRTKSRITDFIALQLGREGAGLSDMPSVVVALRQPLAKPKES